MVGRKKDVGAGSNAKKNTVWLWAVKGNQNHRVERCERMDKTWVTKEGTVHNGGVHKSTFPL